MLKIRRSNERGKTNIDWLESYHTFSFGNYYDPENIHFGNLRVINDDIVAPSAGFPTHGHRDMEIVTYVLSGAVAHKDSTGGEGIIKPGDVQRMSAGKGVLHSEYNPSDKEPLHLLQIWIMPEKDGLKPEYEQKNVSTHKHGLKLIVSRDGREDSLKINQQAEIYSLKFDKDDEIEFPVSSNDNVFLQVAKGDAKLGVESLLAGDSVAMQKQKQVKIKGSKGSEILLFKV